MGQQIEVDGSVIGTQALFVTDRTLTGQDGVGFSSAVDTSGTGFPDRLAAELFAAISGLDRVWIAGNVVTIVRPEGWDDPSLDAGAAAIERFFVHYDG